MPFPRRIADDVVKDIRRKTEGVGFGARLAPRPPSQDPLPAAVPRDDDTTSRSPERRSLLAALGSPLPVVAGERAAVPDHEFRGNIENFVGLVQVPLGVIGPLRLCGLHAQGDFYVPLATTEGALVASYGRGASVVSRAGGARVVCALRRTTRAPFFRFRSLVDAGLFIEFALESFPRLQAMAGEATRHGRLEDLRVHWEGNYVYLLCDYSTGDAAGQNMVTVATRLIAAWLAESSPVRPCSWVVESNLSGDKKASAVNHQYVRGSRVMAEAELPRALVEESLHTTPEAIEAYWKAAFVAASQAGSIGVQGQFANGLAALFLACGQDVACVAEAAMGNVRLERTDAGDLYASVCLPNLIVGTVGGGTGTPTARECLALLGCDGEGTAPKLAEIAAGLVLAGEISIAAALTSGDFTRAHATLGRRTSAARPGRSEPRGPAAPPPPARHEAGAGSRRPGRAPTGSGARGPSPGP
jgi:hydroxymethylglutaryl-CoA reductase (NADPH)